MAAATSSLVPPQSGDVRIERGEIEGKLRRCVALGVDRNEQDVQLLRLGFELRQPVGKLQQGGWTDVRAEGALEELRHWSSHAFWFGHLFATMVDQLERSSDLGMRRRRGDSMRAQAG